MRNLSLILIALFPVFCTQAQNVQYSFNISFKGKQIGTLVATETASGATVMRDLHSSTDAKVLVMAVHVESELKSTKENNIQTNSTAYRHANRGANDIHATITRLSDGSYKCERNGATRIETNKIDFKVIDLYFIEPVGKSKVFSTMYAVYFSIEKQSDGRYVVLTPDKTNTWFTYKSGKLVGVEYETPLGKVIATKV